MRTCLLSGDWKKAYKMSEFQSFKVSKFQRVAPNSVSGLVFYLISFFFVLIFGLGIPDVILAQETSEDAALEDVLSGFDDEGAEEEFTKTEFGTALRNFKSLKLYSGTARSVTALKL